jgi:membrane associated rhomboid family serine protease
MFPIGTNLKFKSVPKITLSLIAINTLVFIFIGPIRQNLHITPLGDYLISLLSVFLHNDIFHLIFNMLFLAVFGSHLEDKIQSKRFLLYYFISEIGAKSLHMIMYGDLGIGSSGAIFGIMGLYLSRCHYSKIKTIIPLVFPFKITINAKWFLVFWFFSDMYNAFYSTNYIAYWTHIGGFLTGLIIGKLNQYWIEANKEHLHERAIECMEKNYGSAEVEKDLRKALAIDPEDPDIHLALARLCSRKSDEKEQAKKYYLEAARLYYCTENAKSLAGEVFLEYLKKYREPVEPKTHLQYANSLAYVFDYSGAAQILEPLIEKTEFKNSLGEMLFYRYIIFTLNAGLREHAENAYVKLKIKYPGSVFIREIASLLTYSKPEMKEPFQIDRAWPTHWLIRVFGMFNEVMSDRLFWPFSFITLSVALLLNRLPQYYVTSYIHIFYLLGLPLILSFILTFSIRTIISLSGNIYGGLNKTEIQGIKAFNQSFYMDKATLCENEKNYEEAVQYLKAVIEEDEKNLEARYKLARLYQKKLNQPAKAIREYNIVLSTSPDDHPYKRDALDSIKELTRSKV